MRYSCVLLILAALLGFTISSQAGELVVIASSDPSITAGAVIDGAQPLSVAADASVTLVSSSGRTIQLTGPYFGAPDTSASTPGSGLVNSLSRLVAEEKKSAGTLAVFPNTLKASLESRPDLWGVDIARGGRYCVRLNQPVMLWWGDASSGAVVTLTDGNDASRSARIEWPQKKRHMAWPREIPITDGAIYVARFWWGGDGERLTTVIMPPLSSDAHHAAWMADHGCTRQALKILDAMAEGTL